jgi:NitT/TauT family transport system substrate-binding protein
MVTNRRAFLLRSSAAVAGLSVLGLAACGDDENGGASESAAQGGDGSAPYSGRVAAVVYPVVPSQTPFMIAIEKGYFEEENLDLEMLSFPQGLDAMRQLSREKLGWAGMITSIGGFADGLTNNRLVGTLSLNPSPTMIVKADSKIQTPADLKGAKIGIESEKALSYLNAQRMVADGGLTNDDVEFVTIGGTPDIATAVDNGIVDAGASIPPLSAQLETDGKARVIWTAAESYEAGGIELPEAGLWADADFIESDGDVVDRWLRALAKGQDFIRADLDGAAAVLAELNDIEIETAVRTLTPLQSGYLIKLSPEGFAENVKIGMEYGLISREVSFEEVADPQFSDAIAQS